MNKTIMVKTKCEFGRLQQGFTLIELLVVIAIIAILATILLPSLNKAKQLAQKAGCLSNLHHLGLTSLLYANDYNNKIPPSIDYAGYPDYTTWDRNMQEYAGDEISKIPSTGDKIDSKNDLFSCPSDKIDRLYGRKRSYSQLFFAYHPSPYNQTEAISLDLFRNPNSDYIYTEWHGIENIRLCQSESMMYWGYYVLGNFSSSLGRGIPPADAMYHEEGNNFLFVDGHTKLVTPDEALKDSDNDYKQHWNWYNLD